MSHATGQTADIGVSVSKHLIVSVNGFSYAVRVPYVHKIVVLPLSHISFLPRVEPYILGTTKVDDEIYTVVDLRILLGKKTENSMKSAVAVLLVYEKAEICAVVDDVIAVIDIDTEFAACSLQESPYISGIVQADGGIISILSVDKIFSPAGLFSGNPGKKIL